MSKNPFEFKIDKIKEEINSTLHKYNDKNFAVAFSGGKDSTLTLLLFFEAIKNDKTLKKRKYYINFSDTQMEMPIYEIYVYKTINRIKDFIKTEGLNIEINITVPERKHKFFNLIIGNGQPMPRTDMRWCSERLKILPQQKLQIPNSITIIGARKEESADRKKRLESNAFEGHLKGNENNINLYAPIEDLKTEEVWKGIKLLSKNQNCLDYNELLKLYQVAGNTESLTPEARFGCWVCPLLKEDRTLKNIALHYPEYKELLEFRNWFVEYQTKWAENKYFLIRDIYNHRNHKINIYKFENDRKGMVSPGGYSLEMRKEFLFRLMTLLQEIKEKDPKFPTEIYLDKEDIIYIQEKWFMEGDFNLSAFQMAKDILGVELEIKNKEIKLILNMILIIATEFDSYLGLAIKEDIKHPLRVEIQAIKRFLKEEKNDIEKSQSFVEAFELSYDYIAKRIDIKQRMKEEGFYFGDDELENLAAEVWSKDEVDFWTFLKRYENGEIKQQQLSLFDEISSGSWDRHFKALKELETLDDPLESKYLTLEEKIKYLESF